MLIFLDTAGLPKSGVSIGEQAASVSSGGLQGAREKLRAWAAILRTMEWESAGGEMSGVKGDDGPLIIFLFFFALGVLLRPRK
jgi:hypothetical protein